jgi:YggT family protein
VLYRIRKVVPYMGGLDLSPLIVIFIIYFIQWAIIPSIIEFALRLKTGGAI